MTNAAVPAALRGSSPPLVGRERELGPLRDCLAAALAGHGGLVLVGGEVGVGKTALVEAFGREAAERGALVLTGGCYDLTATPPYGPWVEMARAYRSAGDLPTFPAALRSEEARQALGSQVALFEAASAFLEVVAGHRPLVLVLEDLHWADPASLDLLRYLSRHVAEHAMLLLATHRSDELTRRHPLYQLLPVLARESRAARLDLQRLSGVAVHALVEPRYRLPDSDQARLVAQLLQHTEGNPLFIEEMLRTYQDDGLLTPANGGWTLGDLGRLHVPPFVRQVIDSRLARLPAGARDLCAVAAVIGQEAPLDLWSVVSAADDDALADAIELAQETHLLEELPAGTGLRFSHALIREVLYEGVVLPRRRTIHRRIGEALAATPAPDPDAVAHHFQQAGDVRAATWLVRAGERARRAYAWLTAAERFEAAVALLEDQEGTERERGRLLYHIARMRRFHAPEQGIACLEEAMRLAVAVDYRALHAMALAQIGMLRCFAGEIRRGNAEIEAAHLALASVAPSEILEITDEFGLSYKVDVRGTHICQHAHAGRFAEARSMGEEFTSASTSAEPRGRGTAAVADGYLGLALALAALGHPDDARRAFARARALYEVAEHHMLIGDCGYFELTELLLPYYTNDLAARKRLAAETERAVERARGALPNVNPRIASLPLLVLEGHWAEAWEVATGMQGSWHRRDYRRDALWLGRLAYDKGDSDLAWAQVRSVLPAGPATEPGDSHYSVASELQRLAANLSLDANDLAAARAWNEAHDRWLAWSGAASGRAEGRLLWARYHRAQGDLAAALAAATEALALASAPRRPLALLTAQRTLAEIETESGRFAEAELRLRASLALADACAAPYERALTLLALAALRSATHEHDVARALLAEARAICTPLDAQLTLGQIAALEADLAASLDIPPRYPDGLTPREVEVLCLIADGATNRAIAETLFLSHRTVERHIANIYLKIDAHSKAEATAYALRHNLA